jgi:ubiquitin C-terminal hydrolase
MAERTHQGIGGILMVALGVLLVLVIVAVFLPIQDCWCYGFAPNILDGLEKDGWRCPKCNNRRKISLFDRWKIDHAYGPGH